MFCTVPFRPDRHVFQFRRSRRWVFPSSVCHGANTPTFPHYNIKREGLAKICARNVVGLDVLYAVPVRPDAYVFWLSRKYVTFSAVCLSHCRQHKDPTFQHQAQRDTKYGVTQNIFPTCRAHDSAESGPACLLVPTQSSVVPLTVCLSHGHNYKDASFQHQAQRAGRNIRT